MFLEQKKVAIPPKRGSDSGIAVFFVGFYVEKDKVDIGDKFTIDSTFSFYILHLDEPRGLDEAKT